MSLLPSGALYADQHELVNAESVRSGIPIADGDLLLAKITPCLENGKQGIVRGLPGGTGMATTEVIRLRGSDLIDVEFLAFVLQAPPIRKKLADGMEGTTGRQRLPRAALERLEIPLPSVAEQRRIAHVLTAIQTARDAAKRVLDTTRIWRLALLSRILGDIEARRPRMLPIRDVVRRSTYIDPAKLGRPTFTYVDVSAVSNESLRIVSPQRISVTGAPSRARKLLRAGDVLIATVRPGLRRIALVPPELDGEIASTGFCVLTPDQSQIEPEYLYIVCSLPSFVARITAHQKGSSYPAITDGVVMDQPIPLPSLEEQRKIARVVTAVEHAVTADEACSNAIRLVMDSAVRALLSGMNQLAS